MKSELKKNFIIRKNFAKIKTELSIPSLIEIQKKSYNQFLQKNTLNKKEIGLQAIFNSIFPVKDYNENASLEFVNYILDEPRFDCNECRSRGMTYASTLKITIRLVIWNKGGKNQKQSIKDIKEQEVYFGEIPVMTNSGTFIINGTERVIVSQLHRSPGVFFEHNKGSLNQQGKILYNARIIPYRGSWLDFELDQKDIIYCRIDRRRKFPATIFLKALGYSNADLLALFYKYETLTIHRKEKYTKIINYRSIENQKTNSSIISPNTSEILIEQNAKITNIIIKNMIKHKIIFINMKKKEINNLILAKSIFCNDHKTILLNNQKLNEININDLYDKGVRKVYTLTAKSTYQDLSISNTISVDKTKNPKDSIKDIYKRARPGDPPSAEAAKILFHNMFFNPEKYDLSKIGRIKLNHKFNINESLTNTILTKKDIIETIKRLIKLKRENTIMDDIDHLGNRRVRSVGELVENQYRMGLIRMERSIRERMSVQEVDTLMPHDLINNKPVASVLKEFFGTSQLSQFMDQTNPLSEITHKRRLSALGPGGLTRDRAGFEVRDVHPTHYGRICPIETPEGPNIGLIASLSAYARVNKYGFVETPYKKVINKIVQHKILYYSALQEEDEIISQANIKLDKNNGIIEEYMQVRKNGETTILKSNKVTLIDVAPNQMVSIAAGLIPFLEHNDANRALMGSNMQRQAVPLIKPESPIVGTGMERIVAKDSGVCIMAKRPGVIHYADSTKIIIKTSEYNNIFYNQIDIYKLHKYRRSNNNTCFNQKTIVNIGDHVDIDDILADGPSMDHGELALGRNVMVAFMPWHGYNFEDSILISEKLIKQDYYTSIHIEEYECISRDTKLGPEEITPDIPNTSDDILINLDDSGIIKIGSNAVSGDILVGKVTPKGETQLSPEEKLLRAVFGEKAGDVKDTSLRMESGTEGIVIDAKIFTRKGIPKDNRTKESEKYIEEQLLTNQNEEIQATINSVLEKSIFFLNNKKTTKELKNEAEKLIIKKNIILSKEQLLQIDWKYYEKISIKEIDVLNIVKQITAHAKQELNKIKNKFHDKIYRLKEGDDLVPGIIKIIKIYIAIKRKIQTGDKMAGRHGNKGVVSRVLPEEDMPYMPNGKPVDIVLNPLGVPSRMNVGQILEAYLGIAAKSIGEKFFNMAKINTNEDLIKNKLIKLLNDPQQTKIIHSLTRSDLLQKIKKFKGGFPVATPVFDGASELDIKNILIQNKYNENGQTILFDGLTGEPFEQNVTVGTMYMLKLHHLVDEKIHARSIGPYSLITQQPLGGKAQFGGQRLGEMEVWALEAYGAAHALQEFLTVKSDDVIGRAKMYEAIIKGEHILESGVPESFNVLIKELQSLGLDIVLFDNINTKIN